LSKGCRCQLKCCSVIEELGKLIDLKEKRGLEYFDRRLERIILKGTLFHF